jgi:hypothetical protein
VSPSNPTKKRSSPIPCITLGDPVGDDVRSRRTNPLDDSRFNASDLVPYKFCRARRQECLGWAVSTTPHVVAYKGGFKIRSQEGHGVPLIAIQTQAHPDQVQMIRHQAIHGTKQTLARGGVQHQLPETGVKAFSEPAGGAVMGGERPMNKSVSLIILARQPGKPTGKRLLRWRSHRQIL